MISSSVRTAWGSGSNKQNNNNDNNNNNNNNNNNDNNSNNTNNNNKNIDRNNDTNDNDNEYIDKKKQEQQQAGTQPYQGGAPSQAARRSAQPARKKPRTREERWRAVKTAQKQQQPLLW